MSALSTRILGSFAILLGLALLAPQPAVAEELAEPQVVIQGISDKMQAILKRNAAKVDGESDYVFSLANDVIVPHIDFGRVSALVLGKYWRRANSEQKKQFAGEFKRLLVRTYATAFREFKEWEIEHLPVKEGKRKGTVYVRTKVKRPGASPVLVQYEMYKHKKWGWKAYDVKIEGISLVTNYRTRFKAQIRRDGLDGLIHSLKAKNDSRVKTALMDQIKGKTG